MRHWPLWKYVCFMSNVKSTQGPMTFLNLPTDVVRYVCREFLCDKDRLQMAQVSRMSHVLAGLDVCRPRPVIFDGILNVHGQPGFHKTRNGYWELVEFLPCTPTTPQELGALAASDPWYFVKVWLSMSRDVKTREFRRQCVHSFCLEVWDPRVLVSMKLLLSCSHEDCGLLCHGMLTSSNRQLLRRAVWYGKRDIVSYMLDEGGIDADVDNGTPLRLALSTLGYEHTEDEVVDVVHELLLRGANPTLHGLWGIRLCLHLQYYVVGSLMCTYAMKWSHGQRLLEELWHDLRQHGHDHHASLVKASMKNFIFVG